MQQPDEPIFSSRHNPETQEADFSDPFGGDPESLERTRVRIRSLRAEDLDAIVRIDRHATGRDRAEYLAQKASEALDQSGVRLSLVAQDDDLPVGYIMARLDYGEFGRTSPMAVIDTIGVDPGYHGIGQDLLEQLVGNLRSLRVEGIRTIVRWDDLALIRFLSQHGFSPAPRIALRCPL